MNTTMKGILAVCLLSCAGALAEGPSSCPAIPEANSPALLYTENDYGSGENRLRVAYQQEGAWKHEDVVSALYVAVEPLDGMKLVLSVGSSAQDCTHHALDLGTGTALPLSERRGDSPIRFRRPHERYRIDRPDGRAYFLQDARGAKDLEFITLDYRAMKIHTETLDKTLFSPSFDSNVRMRIGPGGSHIAFWGAASSSKNARHVLRYVLHDYYVGEKAVSGPANEVLFQLSAASREPMGWPAFCWFDEEHILYQHVEPVDPGATEAKHVFTTVNVLDNEAKRVLGKTLPLPMDGGTLSRDPDSGGFVYVHRAAATTEYVLDLQRNDLRPRVEEELFRLEESGETVRVAAGGKTLFEGTHFGKRVEGIASTDGRHFAYSLATGTDVRDKAQQMELMVNLDGQTAESLGEPIYCRAPLVWLGP